MDAGLCRSARNARLRWFEVDRKWRGAAQGTCSRVSKAASRSALVFRFESFSESSLQSAH